MDELQKLIGDWHSNNFPDEDLSDVLTKASEELGELSGSWCKERVGIKGSTEFWQNQGKDAVGDLVLCLMTYCYKRGWSFEECVKQSFSEVHSRDFNTFPFNGTNK